MGGLDMAVDWNDERAAKQPASGSTRAALIIAGAILISATGLGWLIHADNQHRDTLAAANLATLANDMVLQNK